MELTDDYARRRFSPGPPGAIRTQPVFTGDPVQWFSVRVGAGRQPRGRLARAGLRTAGAPRLRESQRGVGCRGLHVR
ncbi:hypothetical protein G6F59_018210 [Rhizopus arrhizus]|nr:hypothetical protein G6F59_018210 [Rhizopus arrhizus]